MDTHTAKLEKKASELQAQGFGISEILDEVYALHCALFLRGPGRERVAFNRAHGLSDFARPENSLHIVCDIVGGWE